MRLTGCWKLCGGCVLLIFLTAGCTGQQTQNMLMREIDKLNERLNNVNRRLDLMQAEQLALQRQIEQQRQTIADLYQSIESVSAAAARSVESRRIEADAPRHPAATTVPRDEEDIRHDPGQQQAVEGFLQQLKGK